MATLTAPDTDDEIYLGRGSDVDEYRPPFQGDVYVGIGIAGYPTGDHQAVAVLQHPCTMRRGAKLRERVAVIPVRAHQYVPPARWATDYLRIFPLPDVIVGGGTHAAGSFDEPGTVAADELIAAERLSQLSVRGTLLFQQRQIYAATHAVVGLDVLDDFSAPAITEAELLTDWCGELAELHADDPLPDAIALETDAFMHYIREETDLQAALEDRASHPDVRSAVRREVARRKQAGSGRAEVMEPEEV